MTQRFLKAVDHTLSHEGGYNDIKGDNGGATNWGISLRFLAAIEQDINSDGKIDWMDIKSLTKEDAVDLYFLNFWRPIYDMLPSRVGMKVFDVAVNAGHHRAHTLLQRSLNALGSRLKVDGLIGKVTIAECAKYIEGNILATYVIEQEAFYRDIVVKKPKQKKFLNGWLNRAKWVPK